MRRPPPCPTRASHETTQPQDAPVGRELRASRNAGRRPDQGSGFAAHGVACTGRHRHTRPRNGCCSAWRGRVQRAQGAGRSGRGTLDGRGRPPIGHAGRGAAGHAATCRTRRNAARPPIRRRAQALRRAAPHDQEPAAGEPQPRGPRAHSPGTRAHRRGAGHLLPGAAARVPHGRTGERSSFQFVRLATFLRRERRSWRRPAVASSRRATSSSTASRYSSTMAAAWSACTAT